MCFCACLKAFILVKTSIKKMKAPAPIKLDEISPLLQQKKGQIEKEICLNKRYKFQEQSLIIK